MAKSRNEPSDFLYPGVPVAAPLGRLLIETAARMSDVVLVASETVWADASTGIEPDLAATIRFSPPGSPFTDRLVGMSATGMRVSAFSTARDASRFARAAAEAAMPSGVVVHAPSPGGSGAVTFGFGLAASTAQASVDFTLIAHRIAEAALVPGVLAHLPDHLLGGFATVFTPEADLLAAFLGGPGDEVHSATLDQAMLFGERRRRIPAMIDLNRPIGLGARRDAFTERLRRAGVGPFMLDHVPSFIRSEFDEFGALTGRFHLPVSTHGRPEADYVIVTAGPTDVLSHAGTAISRVTGQKIGVVSISATSPFPGSDLASILKGCRVVTVLDDRSNGLPDRIRGALASFPGDHQKAPQIVEAQSPSAGPVLSNAEAEAVIRNMLPGGTGLERFTVGVDFAPKSVRVPSLESLYQSIRRGHPGIERQGLPTAADASGLRIDSTAIRLAANDARSLSLVSNAFAEACFDTLKRPVATVVDERSATRGSLTTTLLAIGTGSPEIADAVEVGILLATRADEVKEVVNNGLLADGAIVVLPAAEAQRALHVAGASLISGSRRLFSVELAEHGTELETLAVLCVAFLNLRTHLAEHAEVLNKSFLEKLAASAGWDVDIRKRVSAVLLKADCTEVPVEPPTQDAPEPIAPEAIKQVVERTGDFTDPSRFWRTVGYAYATDDIGLLAPDPFLAVGAVPAQTGSFRSAVPAPSRLPVLFPETCSGCRLCAAFCPEGAIRTTVIQIGGLIESGMASLKADGGQTIQLERIVGPLAKQSQKVLTRDTLKQFGAVGDVLREALRPLLDAMTPAKETLRDLTAEFDSLLDVIGAVPVIRTDDYFAAAEAESKGSGELFLLGIDPSACTSCGLCQIECPESAIEVRDATPDSTGRLASAARALRLAQPSYADDETPLGFLSGRKPSDAVLGADPSRSGSGIKMAVRLVCALVEHEVGSRLAALAAEAGELADAIQSQIKRLLQTSLEVNDFETFSRKIDALEGRGLTSEDLAEIVGKTSTQRIDSTRLGSLTRALNELESLRDRLERGRLGTGRARMAAVFGRGCHLAESLTYPFNPYRFPWLHIESGSPINVAEGLFEGSLPDLGATFATIRRARKLAKGLNADDANLDLRWDDLTDEERLACPPVCVFTETETDLPVDWLSSRTPIRVFLLDSEPRTLKLWPLVRPDWYVLHSTPASIEHFVDGIQKGLTHPGPSIFRLFAPEPEASGFTPDKTVKEMTRAVDARDFPLFRYQPDDDLEWTDRWSLEGNRDVDDDVPPDADYPTFWRLLQEVAGVRSTALAKARAEARTEIEEEVARARHSIESEAQAEVDRIRTGHTEIYHEALTRRLLEISGFGPGSEAALKRLSEMEDSP